ncbi:MAG TPA: DoxX family protein [Acidobacteriota bacterium]|nr:DoxX family protein [Acidobacteriota bacterium]
MERTQSSDYALFLLRTAGLLLAFAHGWTKFYALVTGQADWLVSTVSGLGFPLPVMFAWAIGLTEFVGGICVAVGLYTRLSASLAAVAMFTAAFIRHRALMHFGAWLGVASPTAAEIESSGNPERALLFLTIMATLVILGPGRLSVDGRLSRRRR